MGVRIVQVDAFASRPFSGNPAGVCVLPAPHDERWMQDVAAEMNLAETAFLHPENEGYRLRWFTPTVEMALCGHATLASAHVLWEEGHLAADQQARFHTQSGLLTADHAGNWIELDFPATPPAPAAAPPGLAAALRVGTRWIGRSKFDYLVEVDSEDVVRGLKPDLAALERVDARGIIVTSRATTPGFDFVSRFFAPQSGVPEDPVTGSAHCALAPYWSERLHRAELTGYQASPRGGVVRVRLEAAIDGRPWNTAGLDGWIRGDRVVLYYRDAAKYRALFRPTFIGRFRERDGNTVLDGRFRMTLFARALLPIWLAPAIVCLVVALVPTQLQPQSPAFRIALVLLGGLLAVMAFGRFALEWWGRPGDVDAVSKAIRGAVQPH